MDGLKASGVFHFQAYGHPNITSRHPTTLEFTRDEAVTRDGDCIIGTRSSHGLMGMPIEIKRVLARESGRGRLTMTVKGESFIIEGRGAIGLTFSHPREIVLRKSGFVSNRTLMIHTNKAAIDLPRHLVNFLRNREERITLELSAWTV